MSRSGLKRTQGHYELGLDFFRILPVKDFDVPLQLGLTVDQGKIFGKFAFAVGTRLGVCPSFGDIFGA